VKVLIVDDEDELRAVLSEYLQAQGLQTIEARNGLECLLQVKHERPDVIVLDLTMPRLGGIEALKRIHQFDARIRVIVLTASEDLAVHQAARAAGASEVYTKPYDLEHLARFIAGAGVTAARNA
jgi:CheY-like chemotaxis protein